MDLSRLFMTNYCSYLMYCINCQSLAMALKSLQLQLFVPFRNINNGPRNDLLSFFSSDHFDLTDLEYLSNV